MQFMGLVYLLATMAGYRLAKVEDNYGKVFWVQWIPRTKPDRDTFVELLKDEFGKYHAQPIQPNPDPEEYDPILEEAERLGPALAWINKDHEEGWRPGQ